QGVPPARRADLHLRAGWIESEVRREARRMGHHVSEREHRRAAEGPRSRRADRAAYAARGRTTTAKRRTFGIGRARREAPVPRSGRHVRVPRVRETVARTEQKLLWRKRAATDISGSSRTSRSSR